MRLQRSGVRRHADAGLRAAARALRRQARGLLTAGVLALAGLVFLGLAGDRALARVLPPELAALALGLALFATACVVHVRTRRRAPAEAVEDEASAAPADPAQALGDALAASLRSWEASHAGLATAGLAGGLLLRVLRRNAARRAKTDPSTYAGNGGA